MPGAAKEIKVFWFFSSEKNVFFEKKKQKTFMSFAFGTASFSW
jgi:hypothetical protein